VTVQQKVEAGRAGMNSESYRALMRHQAGAVTVIASGADGSRAGLTATAVCSLSDNPPTILVCVQRRSGAHDLIAKAGCFSGNLLSREQEDVAERFAGRRGLKGEARFAGLDWGTLETGAPVLAGALASLDCELIDRHQFTTHSIFIGRVVAGVFRADAQPLLYFRGDYWDLDRRD
jgi:flavin reductase (DIM6/NTAB) family NADH-FMN oxidoreductase RutF